MKHGMSRSKTYRSWAAAKSRCINPSNQAYRHYGARGIKMCDRWLNSFQDFLADMGECPPYMYWGLDRIDNEGNYEPGNCRWASSLTQARNRRTTVVHRRQSIHVGMDHEAKMALIDRANEAGYSLPAYVEKLCLEHLGMQKRQLYKRAA